MNSRQHSAKVYAFEFIIFIFYGPTTSFGCIWALFISLQEFRSAHASGRVNFQASKRVTGVENKMKCLRNISMDTSFDIVLLFVDPNPFF